MNMDEDVIVREIVKSLAFEIEATNEGNVLKWATTNGTPLSVKVRVRNPDEPRLVQKGPIPVPRIGITAPDRLRLVSSDQTILSFNIYLDKEAEKQEEDKRSKLFQLFNIGGCLGTISDDDGPYLPRSSNQKAIEQKSSCRSESAILDIPNKIPPQNETKKGPFAKCKPGGCLDPPFGEDKYPYGPSKKLALEIRDLEIKQTSGGRVNSILTEKLQLKTRSKENNHQKLDTESHEVKQKKEIDVIRGASVESSRKSKEESPQCRSSVHIPIEDEVYSKKLTDIYARNSRENSLITYHIDTSSTESLYGPIPNKRASIKSYNESQRQTYEYPESYFVPPKDVLRYKEEERRYSKEPSNYQISASGLPKENDITAKINVIKAVQIEHKSISQNARGSKDINMEKIKLTLTELQPNNVDVAQKVIENKISPTCLASKSQEPVSYILTDSQNIDDHRNVPDKIAEPDFNTTAKSSIGVAKNELSKLQNPKKIASGNVDIVNKEANSDILIIERTITKSVEILQSNAEINKPIKSQATPLSDSEKSKILDTDSNTYLSTTNDKMETLHKKSIDTTDLYSDRKNIKDKPHEKPILPELRSNVVKVADSSYQDVSSKTDQTLPNIDLHKNQNTNIFATPSAIETKKISTLTGVSGNPYMQKEYSQDAQYEFNHSNTRLPTDTKTVDSGADIVADKLVANHDKKNASNRDFESAKKLELNKICNERFIAGYKDVEEIDKNNDDKTTLIGRSKKESQITKDKPNMKSKEREYATLNNIYPEIQGQAASAQNENSKNVGNNISPSRKSSYENKKNYVSSTHSIDFMPKHPISNASNDEVDTVSKKQTSVILQKTLFIPRHDLDIHDDINKTTQPKRHTFTIIGSDTSLSKQEEMEETPKDVTNIYSKAHENAKSISPSQTLDKTDILDARSKKPDSKIQSNASIDPPHKVSQENVNKNNSETTEIYKFVSKYQAHNKPETLNRSNKDPENVNNLILSDKTAENNKDTPYGNASDRHGLLGNQNRDESDTKKTEGSKAYSNKLYDVSGGNVSEKVLPDLYSKDTDYGSPSTQVSGKTDFLDARSKKLDTKYQLNACMEPPHKATQENVNKNDSGTTDIYKSVSKDQVHNKPEIQSNASMEPPHKATQENVNKNDSETTDIYKSASKDQAYNKPETLSRSNKEPEHFSDLIISDKTPENNKDTSYGYASDRHGLLGSQNRDESNTKKNEGNNEYNNKLYDVSSGNISEKVLPDLYSKDTDYTSPSTHVSGKAETLSTSNKDLEKGTYDDTITSSILQKHIQESIEPPKLTGYGKSALSPESRDNTEVVVSDAKSYKGDLHLRNIENSNFSLTSEDHDKTENVIGSQEKMLLKKMTAGSHESMPENIENLHSKNASYDILVPVFPIVNEPGLMVTQHSTDLGLSEESVQDSLKELYAHVTDDAKLAQYIQNREKSESLSITNKLMENKTYSFTTIDTPKKSIPRNEKEVISGDIDLHKLVAVNSKSDRTEHLDNSDKGPEDKTKLEDAKYNDIDGIMYSELDENKSPKLFLEVPDIAHVTEHDKYIALDQYKTDFKDTESNQLQINISREKLNQSDVFDYNDIEKASDFTKTLAEGNYELNNNLKSVSETNSPHSKYSGIISEVLSNISEKAEEEEGFTNRIIGRETTLGRDKDLIQINTEINQDNELLREKKSYLTEESKPITHGSNIELAPALDDKIYNVPKNTLGNTSMSTFDLNRDAINKTVTGAFEAVKHMIDDSDQVKQQSNDYQTIIKKSINIHRDVPLNKITEVEKPIHYRSSKVPISVNNNIDLNGESFDTKPFLYNSGEEQKERTSPSHQGIKESEGLSKNDLSYLDMSFYSYINNDNQRVVQTYSPPNEQHRHDVTVTLVKTLIRHGNEIRIPVDKENDLTLNIVDKDSAICQAGSNIGSPTRYRHREHHILERAKRQDILTKNLALIYESGLIPLHNVIKDLTQQVNNITAKQEILQELKLSEKRTKSLRLIPIVKRCGCKHV